jgi:hypothetical protein
MLVKRFRLKEYTINPSDKKYKPNDDIPHTAAIDPMERNLRNQLLMFFGKFSVDPLDDQDRYRQTGPLINIDIFQL